MMKLFLICCTIVVATSGTGLTASIKNIDAKTQTIIIAEGDNRRDVVLKTDQQISVCLKGCFITMPNGDRVALDGDETVEINNGRANFR